MATSGLKLITFKSVEFKKKNIFDWECIVMDTDFCPLFDIKTIVQKGYGPIKIGDGI